MAEFPLAFVSIKEDLEPIAIPSDVLVGKLRHPFLSSPAPLRKASSSNETSHLSSLASDDHTSSPKEIESLTFVRSSLVIAREKVRLIISYFV